MSVERTLSIIKPDAVAKTIIGQIYSRFEQGGLKVIAAKMLHLTRTQAADFYAVHKERPFYSSLVMYMTSGPVIPMALEKENAVEDFRRLIGATDPSKAEEGTIRKLYAESIERNIVHGSDSPENAVKEISHFFREEDLV